MEIKTKFHLSTRPNEFLTFPQRKWLNSFCNLFFYTSKSAAPVCLKVPPAGNVPLMLLRHPARTSFLSLFYFFFNFSPTFFRLRSGKQKQLTGAHDDDEFIVNRGGVRLCVCLVQDSRRLFLVASVHFYKGSCPFFSCVGIECATLWCKTASI